MKPTSLFAIAGSAFALLFAFPTVAGDQTNFAIFSICRAEQHETILGSDTRHITIENGLGDGGFPIATSNPVAQRWFNFGIKLFHDFYHEDARQAFDNAVAADPNCAMCLWGQALSRGPVMNFDSSEEDLKAAIGFAHKAEAAAQSKREKILAAAMVRRYAGTQDVSAEREFAEQLIAANAAGPSTTDLPLLATEVLMTAFRRGDKTTAPEAVALIEPILRANPDNTAAIHYYIHATEYAGQPKLALPYAEKLSKLAPKASHLVHMASHTYFHVGRYEDAAAINAFALQVDAQHLADTSTPGPLSAADYYEHNLMFGMAGTLMSGDHDLALKFADHVHKAFLPSDFKDDGASALEGKRYIIYAKYDPERLLAFPEPPPANPMTASFYHYARGEVYAARHDAEGVARELALIKVQKPFFDMARNVLEGRLAMLQGRYETAVTAFEAGAKIQETTEATAFDPPPWWYPIRRSIAAAWLQSGQFQKSADAAKASLAVWPDDPLALLILARSEDALGDQSGAHHSSAAMLGAWKGDITKVDILTL